MILEVWFAGGTMEMQFVHVGAREGSLGRSKVTRCRTCPSSAELCEVSPRLPASACQVHLSLQQAGLSSSHGVTVSFDLREARALGSQRDPDPPIGIWGAGSTMFPLYPQFYDAAAGGTAQHLT